MSMKIKFCVELNVVGVYEYSRVHRRSVRERRQGKRGVDLALLEEEEKMMLEKKRDMMMMKMSDCDEVEFSDELAPFFFFSF